MSFVDYYNVEFSDDKRTLVKCPKSHENEYAIPEGVQIIETEAFSGCLSLRKLVLPSTLQIIKSNAFKDCTALTEIYYNGNIEDWLNVECEATFYASYRLFFKTDGSYKECKIVMIPKSVREIRARAFYYCSSLSGCMFHEDVKCIGESAFNKSGLFGYVNFPKSLTTIENYAFLSCKRLTGVDIGENVTHIGEGCFAYCDNLQSLSVSEDNFTYCSDDNNNVIYDKFKTVLLACVGKGSSLEVERSCKKILNYTFAGCRVGQIFFSGLIEPVKYFNSCTSKFFVPYGKMEEFVKSGFPQSQIYERCDQSKLLNKGFLSYIVDNPYRILGSYTTDSFKQITANTTKLIRYAEVEKDLQFDSDSLLANTPLKRDVETIQSAYSSLKLNEDRIKYAIFWFGLYYNFENEILEAIKSQNFDRAFDILFDREDFDTSVTINTSLLCYLKKDYVTYLSNMCYVLRLNSFRDIFFEAVLGDKNLGQNVDLVNIFLDAVYEEMSGIQLYRALLEKTARTTEAAYIREKIIGQYTTTINGAIAKAKRVEKDNSELNFKAANELISSTKEALKSVKNILGEADQQYATIADSLSNQILQSGIHFFNSSDDDMAIYKALEIQSYAESLAVGKLTKQRCKENTDILKKILGKLPPKDLLEFDAKVKSFIDSCFEVYDDMSIAVNAYGEFVGIFKKFAEKHKGSEVEEQAQSYFASISSNFANTILNKLIDNVNSALELSKGKNADMFRGSYGGNGMFPTLVLTKAWETIYLLQQLPLTVDFKQIRLIPNKESIEKILGKVPPVKLTADHFLDHRTEEDLYGVCSSSEESCRYYIKRHPNGKFIKEVQHYIDDYGWKNCRSIADYRKYVNNHKFGDSHYDEAMLYIKIYEERDAAAWSECKTLASYKKYLEEFTYGLHRKEAEEKLQHVNSRITIMQIFGAVVIVGMIALLILL